jgi:cytochrome P450
VLAGFRANDPGVVEDPFAFYAALRETAPVHFAEEIGAWLVSRHADVLEVVSDPARFSSAIGPIAVMPAPAALAILARGIKPVSTLLTADPPAHTRYRALVSRAFAPRRVARMEASVRAVAESLVAGFRAAGAVELVAEFAVPFPLTVIADQLGVPRADLPRFKRWSDDFVALLGGMVSTERFVECARGIVEFQDYFRARIEERRAEPRDDMLTDLVQARLPGEQPLDLPEMISILQQFLVAGNETSTNMIAAAIRYLLASPEQLALVRADPALVPAAVEEALRLETPTQTLFRAATRDTELCGVPLPKGARLAVLYGSANRDPTIFPEPDRFDVRRPNLRDHLAFGHGTHFCLGAGLARKEGAIALELLLGELPGLRFAPGRNDFAHHPSLILRGLRELHLRFDPPGPAALG